MALVVTGISLLFKGKLFPNPRFSIGTAVAGGGSSLSSVFDVDGVGPGAGGGDPGGGDTLPGLFLPISFKGSIGGAFWSAAVGSPGLFGSLADRPVFAEFDSKGFVFKSLRVFCCFSKSLI